MTRPSAGQPACCLVGVVLVMAKRFHEQDLSPQLMEVRGYSGTGAGSVVR